MDKEVLDYIDSHKDEYIELIQELCRQPSIAATGEGIKDMVKLVVKKLEEVGANPTLYETPGNPVVYGEIKGESERIFGFYDHYDVQPVDPIELWDDDPYSAVIKDDIIYARGVADNKNGLASKLCAIDAFLKVKGKLPCGIKFFIEGEEEIGSPNLTYFAEKHKELLKCDGFNWESGWKEPNGPAEIHFGNKGLLYIELKVKTAGMDSHSAYASTVKNPAWRLVWALSTIKDNKDKITIDGFYDGIPEVTEEEIELLKRDNYDEEAWKKYLGLDGFVNDLTGIELLKKYYFEPTANICGIFSGYTGEGSKTVNPAEATVKIDFRLVPGQEPENILKLLRTHLDKNGFQDIEIVKLSAQPAFRSPLDSPFAKAVITALRDQFGEPVIHNTITGTSPMPIFCLEQGIPAALFGCMNFDSNIHAPNEHMPIESYMQEIKMMAAVMEELGKQ